jgi:glucose/arabinose dehydrogenase
MVTLGAITLGRRISLALSLTLALALSVTLLAAPPAVGHGHDDEYDEDDRLIDPLPQPTESNLTITLEEFAQLPESEMEPPGTGRLDRWNRINYVGEVPDGSGRLFVPDLNGPMYLLDKETGEHTEYLNMRDEIGHDFWDQFGLASGSGYIEFHPEFADNGKFYTVHTEAGEALENETPDIPSHPDPATHSVLTEWTAEDPSADVFSGTSREVLRVGFQTPIHNFEQIKFNPYAEPGDEDYGLLYIGSGDGGWDAIPTGWPLWLNRAEGKILRIDPFGDDSSNGQYGIPETNPHVDDEDALGEIYARGLRNPQRFSWDAVSGRLFLGNIGQWEIESIYEVVPGANFGFPVREGPFVQGGNNRIFPLPEDDHLNGYTYPVAAYSHFRDPDTTGDAGVAIAGGYVYRGSEVPQLNGLYLFSDIVSGEVWYTRAGQMRIPKQNAGVGGPEPHEQMAEIFEVSLRTTDGEEITLQELAEDERVDTRLGIDRDGELYFLSKANGTIWKVVDATRAQN